MIAMIDNYDSFTYNLVQYMRQIGATVKVFRNDAVSVDELKSLNPGGLVISPGPGRPETAGISLEAISSFSGKIPVLGVCLGHQSIAQAFGAKITLAEKLMHGKTSMVTADGESVFTGIQKPFKAMRYHSLVVGRDSVPDCFKITAESDDGEIMGLRHKEFQTEGIQFHPESIMTPKGKKILRNYIEQTKKI